MNFRDMPELHWQFGYLYALGLMALSGAVCGGASGAQAGCSSADPAVTAAQRRSHSGRHHLGLRARLGPRQAPVTEP